MPSAVPVAPRHSKLLQIDLASSRDLTAINALIERAVMAWPMAERVKRRAAPILQYDRVDAGAYELSVCRFGGSLVGVTAVDLDFNPTDTPPNDALLHGIYTDPEAQGYGIGKTLLATAEKQARNHARHRLIVKAERVSRGFFERCGYTHIPPRTDADYPYVYSKTITAHNAAPPQSTPLLIDCRPADLTRIPAAHAALEGPNTR